MRVYLDTTVLVALLFGELSAEDQARQPVVREWFQTANAVADVTLFISLYALQELVIFIYDNYPPADAPTVLRLAMLTLFQNRLTLLPLLDRVDMLRYQQRVSSLLDRSDLPHVILALKQNCDYLMTYDEHFASVTEVTAIAPADLLPLLWRRLPTNMAREGRSS